MPVICSPLPSTVDIFDYQHIRGLDLADCSEIQDDHHSDTVDVLIGLDHYWSFMYGKTIRGDSGPVAVSSKFGWVLSGQTELTSERGVRRKESSANLVIYSQTEDFLDDNVPQNDQLVDCLKQFWETEAIGIVDGDDLKTNPVPNNFIEDIAFDGQNYEVGLPWKDSSFPVSNGYDTCSKRLQSLHRKLQADPVLLNEYNKIICDQIEAGIIERVPETSDFSNKETRINFLPHHPVIRKDKDTTKVRIVYDGSAKGSNDERSLNDCLQIGPNFTPHVFDILVKFRWNAIGITADIEKAFLMIAIKEVDRDALRFLWFDDPNECHPKLTMYCFRRLVFGLRPSPSILGFTIKHHLSKYSQSEPKLVEVLENSFYVDDLITGEDSVEESFQIYKGSKQIMATGGFNLRKWHSNSDELLAKIESNELGCEKPPDRSLMQPNCQTFEEDESYAKSTTGHYTIDTADNTVKVLGANWNTKSDEIFFNFERWKEEATSLPMTKRSLLVLTAKIFDSLGYLAPLTILMKVLFQVLCTNKVDWDEELTGDLLKKFQAVIQDISLLHSVRIPSDAKGDTTGSRDSTSKIIQFGLYLDEAGVLRSRGRLNESSLPLDSKNPIFLPNNHSFVNLLILHTHNGVKHSGVRDTLTTIRERFWILRGREVVKKLISTVLFVESTRENRSSPSQLQICQTSEFRASLPSLILGWISRVHFSSNRCLKPSQQKTASLTPTLKPTFS